MSLVSAVIFVGLSDLTLRYGEKAQSAARHHDTDIATSQPRSHLQPAGEQATYTPDDTLDN